MLDRKTGVWQVRAAIEGKSHRAAKVGRWEVGAAIEAICPHCITRKSLKRLQRVADSDQFEAGGRFPGLECSQSSRESAESNAAYLRAADWRGRWGRAVDSRREAIQGGPLWWRGTRIWWGWFWWELIWVNKWVEKARSGLWAVGTSSTK